MKKLFSCLFGSRLYGTQTPTSDLDWKHVYLPDFDEMLIGKQLVNKVKKTNNAKNTRNGADDVDEEFIPLQIFARDFLNGQTYALEMAFAVEGDHASQVFPASCFCAEDDEYQRWYQLEGDRKYLPFYRFVRELREKFLTSNVKALMGYAVSQAALYSLKGERLNCAREFSTILDFADSYYKEDGLTLAEVYHAPKWRAEFDALAAKYPKYFKAAMYDIGGNVMKPCFVLLTKTFPFTNSISMSMKVASAVIKKYGSRADDASVDNVDWKATMHALRVVDEGIALLDQGRLTFPFEPDYVAKLLSIKRGEVPLADVTTELNLKVDRLKDLETTTGLRKLTPELAAEFEVWLAQWMRRFYNV